MSFPQSTGTTYNPAPGLFVCARHEMRGRVIRRLMEAQESEQEVYDSADKSLLGENVLTHLAKGLALGNNPVFDYTLAPSTL